MMACTMSSIKPPLLYKTALAIMAVGKFYLWPKAAPLFSSWAPGACLGIPLFLIGAHVAIDSKTTFKKSSTPMMGGPRNSPLHTSGYFAYTRNPMYLGISVALAGAALVTNCAWHLIAPIANILIMNQRFVPVEERELENAFGAKYRSYKQSVPRWFKSLSTRRGSASDKGLTADLHILY